MKSPSQVLIDTSSWIEALRTDGDLKVRARVQELLLDNRAAWCDMVLLELWNGARGEKEKSHLAELEKEIIFLPTTPEVWSLSRQLAKYCRIAGKTVPATDLLIAACSLTHGVPLEHSDAHFEAISKVHSHSRS